MGSLHNMFGATNVVHIRTLAGSDGGNGQKDSNGNKGPNGHKGGARYTVEQIVKGQTMQEVLGTAQHKGAEMLEVYPYYVFPFAALRCMQLKSVVSF
jgi:hypothetical protein